ncbi:sialidase family protein [Poriferisphaera sp. WC338]|uniref:sialidase family protein n=1 Tax=Poriferisphaera sp. WC338 TaxID=3425129 RepID=UPI003D817A86
MMTRRFLIILLASTLLIPSFACAEPMFEKTTLFKRPTSKDHYRSPALTVLPNGRIIAKGTLKVGHMRDAGGKDINYYKYSDDNGKTWHETKSLRPATVVDDINKRMFRFVRKWPMKDSSGKPTTEHWMIEHPQEGFKLGGGLKVFSSTDGENWGKGIDIADSMFLYKTGGLAWFIGDGIQLTRGPHAGRLVIPGRYFGKQWERVGPNAHNTVAYSDDFGKTWLWGGSSQGYSGEACIVELSDGAVYMSNRNHHPRTAGYRTWAISRDGGETFTEFGVEKDLKEPKCHAAMIRYNFPDKEKGIKGRVLFINPSVYMEPSSGIAPHAGRKNMTVHMSLNDCKSWPISKQLHAGKSGYSDIAVAPDGTILCVFESGEDIYAENITLVRFNMEWLESKK